VEKNRIIVVIVLALGFCCGQAVSSFMPQTSMGQKVPADTMNATLTSSSIKPENTTNILSDAVSEQSVETPAEGTYNVTNNMTAAGQPLGESEETLSNVSETIGEVLTNRSQELSITSEYLESGYLDQLPTLPDPQSVPTFANQLLCSAASNPCVGTDQADKMT
jgi:ABC-type Na+ efflux pump permease subunit